MLCLQELRAPLWASSGQILCSFCLNSGRFRPPLTFFLYPVPPFEYFFTKLLSPRVEGKCPLPHSPPFFRVLWGEYALFYDLREPSYSFPSEAGLLQMVSLLTREIAFFPNSFSSHEKLLSVPTLFFFFQAFRRSLATPLIPFQKSSPPSPQTRTSFWFGSVPAIHA